MASGSVKFEGNGPFYIRSVKYTRASVLADTVQLSLFAAVEGVDQILVQIETQMTLDAAEELANTLSRALESASEEINLQARR